MTNIGGLSQVFIALLVSPLFLGVTNKTKAFFAGRKGPPLLQIYFDLFKLFRKIPVYSRSTSFLFKLGPIVGFTCVLLALFFVATPYVPAFVSFNADFLVFVYVLGVSRFFTVISALDTASSFEGMGASREALYSTLIEPAFLISLIALSRNFGELGISPALMKVSPDAWITSGVILGLIATVLFVVLLVENSRVPIDDPNTHLELTMIHEVMVLDHSGPEFGLITYSSCLKLWLFASFLSTLIFPFKNQGIIVGEIIWLIGIFLIAIVVGAIESSMARFRLLNIPRLLLGVCALSIIALLLVLR